MKGTQRDHQGKGRGTRIYACLRGLITKKSYSKYLKITEVSGNNQKIYRVMPCGFLLEKSILNTCKNRFIVKI